MTDFKQLWQYIQAMQRDNVRHRTKHYALGEVDWDTMMKHLRDEVKELSEAESRMDVLNEVGDAIGVLLHMAIVFDCTPEQMAELIHKKLQERFEIPAA